jgi:hypothetical protein
MHTERSKYTRALSTEEHFLENLDIAIEFHRTNQNDPRGVDLAVMTALSEVKSCYESALKHQRIKPSP